MINKRILNKAVKAKGNQTKLAAYFGFSRQMMSLIMTGKRPFPSAKIDKLINLLDIKDQLL